MPIYPRSDELKNIEAEVSAREALQATGMPYIIMPISRGLKELERTTHKLNL